MSYQEVCGCRICDRELGVLLMRTKENQFSRMRLLPSIVHLMSDCLDKIGALYSPQIEKASQQSRNPEPIVPKLERLRRAATLTSQVAPSENAVFALRVAKDTP